MYWTRNGGGAPSYNTWPIAGAWAGHWDHGLSRNRQSRGVTYELS